MPTAIERHHELIGLMKPTETTTVIHIIIRFTDIENIQIAKQKARLRPLARCRVADAVPIAAKIT